MSPQVASTFRPFCRVALVSGPDAGHAFPVIALGCALRDRGHEVTVATGPQWEHAIESEGLDYLELPLLAPTDRDYDLGYRIWGRAAQMAPPLAERLAGRADVVVTDTLTQAGAFAAELIGLPWVEVAPHYLADPAPDLPPVGLGARRPRTPLGRLDHRRIRRLQQQSIAAGQALRGRYRAELGLVGDGAPNARLFATLPGLEYRRRNWPARTYVVGPLEWEPPWPPLQAPQGEGPLVLVSDSTASSLQASIAGAALEGLADASVRVVATTSRRQSGRRPPACVVGRGPHGPLVDEAAVVVAPGGHGLVAKALARGVPLVVVPLQGDQRETARRVAVAGAGLIVRPGPALPTRLRLAVDRILSSGRYRDAAQRLAADLDGLGPPRAAEIVEAATAGVRAVPAAPP